MLKANTGFSLNDNARLAGKEAANLAKLGLAKVKMAFVYFNNTYDSTELLAGIREALSDASIIGCSTCYGVILPQGFISGKYFIGILAIEDDELTVGIGAVQYDSDSLDMGIERTDFDLGTFKFDDDPIGTARQAAFKAMESAGKKTPPQFFYMVSPPSMEERYINGISSVIGRVPFAGSTAGDSQLGTKWILLSDEYAMFDGLVVAFFYGGKTPVTHYASPYRPTGHYGMVTKMIANRCLVEINGRPALEVFAERHKCPIQFLRGGDLSLVTPLMPLGVKSLSGNLVSICHPQYGNPDGSAFISSPLYEGMGVMGMECAADDIVHGCGSELEAFKKSLTSPAGAFHLSINYCWKLATEDGFNDLVANIQSAADGVPFLCALTNGEHGFKEDSGNTCGSLMMSYICFTT